MMFYICFVKGNKGDGYDEDSLDYSYLSEASRQLSTSFLNKSLNSHNYKNHYPYNNNIANSVEDFNQKRIFEKNYDEERSDDEFF